MNRKIFGGILFPNELILQGTFALYETVGDIYEFIKEYLNFDSKTQVFS